MKYTVQISELISHNVNIEANTIEEAKQKAIDAYYDGEITLSTDDCVDGSVQFEVISETA